MITEGNTREIYDITGLTPLAGGYEFTFPYSSSQDVRVYTTGNKIDTEVPSSNYTIDKSGATPKVVFNAGYSFPAGQTRLTIIRNVSYSQELDLRNGDLIDADKLEGALDDITQQIQQVAEKVDRAILASVSDTVPLSIPESTERSNMLLGFDNEGKVIPVLTTDIEQKLSQALAAEESAITAKNAAETAQNQAEAAKDAAETSQVFAETAQERAEAAEASCQALLGSIATKTEESIASVNTAKTGAVGAVSTQQAASVAAVQAAQNTAESDIAGKRASALTAIDSAKTSAVSAVNTQKETSVAAADREIVAKRDAALSDIQTARTNASNAITSQKDSSLQEIEQLASERKAEINSLAANQKADVKQYTDAVVASAKTEIDTEKTTAITAVQEEGATQVAAVQSIYAEDYARVTAENNALKVEVARNRRQIENLNDRLDGYLIENKFKMTGETPDDPGVLSLPPSKLLPNAEVDEIHGKTVVWNQLVGDYAKYGFLSDVGDGYIKIDGYAGSTFYVVLLTEGNNRIVSKVGHKYLFRLQGNTSNTVRLYNDNGGLWTPFGGGGFILASATAEKNFYIRIDPNTYDNLVVRPQVIDITDIGLGDVTSVDDPRLEWFKTYADTHPQYDAGSLVDASNIVVKSYGRNILKEDKVLPSVGFNKQVDGYYAGAINTAQILGSVFKPNTQYTFSWRGHVSASGVRYRIRIYYTDGTVDYVASNNETTDTTVYGTSAVGKTVGAITGYYGNNGLVFIKWMQIEEGKVATDYTPYREPFVLDLSFLSNLPNIGMEGTVIDFEKKTVTWNYGKMDLGSLKWTYTEANKKFYSKTYQQNIKPASSTESKANVICAYYRTASVFNLNYDAYDMCVGVHSNSDGEVQFKNLSKTSSDLVDGYASWMDGVELLYELSTPIEKTFTELGITPIDNGLAIESNGTITVECEGAQAEALIHYAIDNRS